MKSSGDETLQGPAGLEDQVEDAPNDEQAYDEDDDDDPEQYFQHEPTSRNPGNFSIWAAKVLRHRSPERKPPD